MDEMDGERQAQTAERLRAHKAVHRSAGLLIFGVRIDAASLSRTGRVKHVDR